MVRDEIWKSANLLKSLQEAYYNHSFNGSKKKRKSASEIMCLQNPWTACHGSMRDNMKKEGKGISFGICEGKKDCK